MKAFVICAILATLATVTVCDPNADFQQQLNQCKAEVKVGEADIKKFMESGQNPAAATDGIKCLLKCLMEKQGDLKGGVFNTDNVLNGLKDNPAAKSRMADIQKALAECKNEKGANECDTAFKITMCLKKFKLDQ